MSLMQWSEKFATGFRLIDEQHRKLVDMVSAVVPQLEGFDQVPVSDVAPLLNQLADYAVFHFGFEEDLMLAARIDAGYFARHQQLHNRFAQEITQAIQKAEAGQNCCAADLLRLISDWLTQHIFFEDQEMARQLKLIESGVPPEKALACAPDEEGRLWKS